MFDFLKTIGVWGDSVLKGVIFDEIRGTYQLLANSCGTLLSRTLGLKILNKSKFGSTIDKGRVALEKSLAEGLQCDYVLLEYGGNDCDFDWPAVARDPESRHEPHTPLVQFSKQLDEIMAMLNQRQIKPILMSLPPISGERYLDFLVKNGLDRRQLLRFLGDSQQIYRYHEMYSLAVTSLALRSNSIYAPVREAFLEAWDLPSFLCLDGIHPNEKGHRLMQQVFTDMVARV